MNILGTIISFKPSEDILKVSSIKLEYQSIFVQNESQAEKIIQMCLSTCTKSASLFCKVYEEQSILIRNVAFDVIRKTSFASKTSALMFLTEYFEHRSFLSDEDTQFFVSIIKTMSIIFHELPNHIQEETSKFKKTSLEFFEKVPVKRMNFNNQEILHSFVVCVSEILFNKLNNIFATMLYQVLDDVDYSPESVDSLRHLVHLENSTILSLMKYVVIAELEQTTFFNHRVTQVSSTWQQIHKQLLTKIKALPSSNDHEFLDLGYKITEILFLAHQIEFSFSSRHQIRHGLHPQTCFCSTLDESQETNLMIKDWNYKHVSLIMFDDIEGITKNLIEVIKARTSVNAESTRIIIDIGSCILKFSMNNRMIETMKHILMAIVASPFNKCLKNHQKYSKQLGFQKVMTLLPVTINTFFEVPMPDKFQEKFQCESIAALSSLEIRRMGVSCWDLIKTIVEYVTSQSNVVLKETLCSNLTNFCINNIQRNSTQLKTTKDSDEFAFFLDVYQKLLKDKTISSAFLKPLSNILCLTGGNFMTIKLLSNEDVLSYLIICNDCQLALIEHSKDSRCDDLHRQMTYLKESKGVLISSDDFANKKMILMIDTLEMFSKPKEFIICLIPSIPSLLSHSRRTTMWIQSDKGSAFFKSIFIKNEEVLMVLKDNLKEIIGNIRAKDFGSDLKIVLNNCLVQIAEIVQWTSYDKDKNLQSITINLLFIYATNVIDENVMVKCLKMLTNYIVQTDSQVIGEASLLALEVAKRYGAPLIQLFNWHKTFIMRHVFNYMLTNLFAYKNPLLDSMINVR